MVMNSHDRAADKSLIISCVFGTKLYRSVCLASLKSAGAGGWGIWEGKWSNDKHGWYADIDDRCNDHILNLLASRMKFCTAWCIWPVYLSAPNLGAQSRPKFWSFSKSCRSRWCIAVVHLLAKHLTLATTAWCTVSSTAHVCHLIQSIFGISHTYKWRPARREAPLPAQVFVFSRGGRTQTCAGTGAEPEH